jgi:hypothetical protein
MNFLKITEMNSVQPSKFVTHIIKPNHNVKYKFKKKNNVKF